MLKIAVIDQNQKMLEPCHPAVLTMEPTETP